MLEADVTGLDEGIQQGFGAGRIAADGPGGLFASS